MQRSLFYETIKGIMIGGLLYAMGDTCYEIVKY